MIPQLAWRNIWRNKTRSLVVIMALTSGLTGAIFIGAMVQGMVDKWVERAINEELSDIQIHNSEYLVMEDLNLTLDEKQVDDYLGQQSNVRSHTSRLLVDAMAMTANNSRQIKMQGIDPVTEKTVTTLYKNIKEGDYFETERRTKPIVVSQRLCDKLKIRLKSKIIISLADANGEIQYENFRVSGIYKTSSAMFDDLNVFVKKEHLRQLLSTGQGQVHMIALRLEDTAQQQAQLEDIQSNFPSLKARGWQTIDPMIALAESTMGLYSYILVTVVLIALVFGIINTMLMVILERTKEIGMLRALGMNNKKIARMIMLETVMLCLVGVTAGNAISMALVHWFGVRGINLERYADGFETMGVSAIIYPSLDSTFYINITLMVIFTALFSSIFPIIRAFKLNPATAIRD